MRSVRPGLQGGRKLWLQCLSSPHRLSASVWPEASTRERFLDVVLQGHRPCHSDGEELVWNSL